MRLRQVTQHGLMLIAMLFAVQCSQAQTSGAAQALQEYELTVRQADALVAGGDAFEAVRLYERAGRIAYNSKLTIDTAALNAKLGAARSARDRKPAAAAPATAPTATAAPPTPSTSGDAATRAEAEDANAWIRYGDGLATASEYIDAVRAYERGRRLAINNRVPIDRVALDAKIAAAAQARDSQRPSLDLIPEPLPPLPREPGAEPDPPYLRDRPGKLRPWTVSALYSRAEMKVTDAEFNAFDANLRRVMDVLTRAPVLSPPMGFELDVAATLGSFQDVNELQRYVGAHLPLRGELRFSAAPYVDMRWLRSRSTAAPAAGVGVIEEVYCRAGIVVNVGPGFEDGNAVVRDGDDTFVLEPKKSGELDGMPVYNDTLVISRPGAVLWTPVSTERALKALIPHYKSAADSVVSGSDAKKKAYADFMSPEAQDKRRREVAEQRQAGAEANARKLEVMQRRWEEDARKAAEGADTKPSRRKDVDAYRNAQAMLLALDPAGRAAPACIDRDREAALPSDWRVVPIGTPGCRPLVQRNPDLLNGKLPRSELQVLSVPRVTMVNRWLDVKKHERAMPGDCVAMARILRETRWHQLVDLLAH